MDNESDAMASPPDRFSDVDHSIAIVGMAGRFPGANDVGEFWKNICDGVESIRRFEDSELEDSFDLETRNAPNFVKARPILDDVDRFDAEFFGIYAKEAELMDPQHRVFLECAWHALEDAGYDPAKYPGNIGVFAGSSVNTYFLRHVCQSAQTIHEFTNNYQVGSYSMLTGASQDFLATRVSYKLNLRGPSITVQSACSTSLLAVAQACQSLLLYQSDMALAGGVSITFPQRRGYLSQEGGMVSQDGHCRSFDANASGTVFGSGLGIVVLKRTEDALRDGDHIYAVIRGCGVNNDGATKVGFTAPSVTGQANAIEMAIASAGVDARSISYVECHGTATPLGDPIEVAGLTQAFRTQTRDRNFCAIGSVKSNVGHLDVAAGVTGLIKVALALAHKKLPATLHFNKPNPQIDFAQSPFYVNAQLRDWQSASPRRAGVSAFGVGGTNVHAVLEEAPPMNASANPANAEEPHIFVLSARNEAALQRARSNLAEYLRENEAVRLSDIAFTLQVGRREFDHRYAVVASSRDELIRKMADNKSLRNVGARFKGEIVTAFMFPGQGAQYPAMARELYETEPVFKREFDTCADLLLSKMPLDLRQVVFFNTDDDAAKALQATSHAQPALFAIEYALAKLWLSWGIRPRYFIGHSVGEFAAAVLANVMSLESALTLVAARGELMQQLPKGAMLAVRASEAVVREALHDSQLASLDIAAINSPTHCVVSGPEDDIAAFEAQLATRNIAAKRLHTSHAFHSNMVTPMIDAFRSLVRDVRLSAPTIPFVSCVSGALISDAQATSPDYWAQHARAAVRFADGVRALATHGVNAFVEVGPGNTLATLTQQTLRDGPDNELVVVTSLPSVEREIPDANHIRNALAQLWIRGVEPKWQAFHFESRRVPLPTYPFERKRYWIEATNNIVEPVRLETPSTIPVLDEIVPPPSQAAGGNAIATELCALFEELAGERRAEPDSTASFLELGFDSLFLTQVAQRLERQYKLKITFRQLLGDLSSIPALCEYLEDRGATSAKTATREKQSADQDRDLSGVDDVNAPPSRFKAYVSGAKQISQMELNEKQQQHLQDLIARYCAKTAGSKRYTQSQRAHLADPRAAAGFRSEWKELVYPIVAERASGSKIWDIDGNEYIDLVNGYGQTAFGHSPSFVVDAVQAQLAKGFAIGPQAELAGEVARLIVELTGNERAAFCNTGSEAVMAAMRIARAVTGRDKVVVFDGAYHGQFDEVLVHSTQRSAAERKSLPVAVGIPRTSVQNMVVLEYAAPESLQWIREHAEEIAAVIVEPVQSRRPQLRPKEFLRALREVTANAEIAFVMDEVVTGFRVHPGGMQAVFGIRADLVTYGKVIGGGLPIGIVAGKSKFMDALDGGQWQYGDDSFPEVGVTFFAGTFVRHPLALAATHAVLLHLKDAGAGLQSDLSKRTTELVSSLNEELENAGIAARLHNYASWFYFNVSQESPLASLLFYHLRLRGIHIQEGFPCFLTTAHSDRDLQQIVEAFRSSLQELRDADIMGGATQSVVVKRVPLTESQLEIWLAAQQGDDASSAFNESITLRLRGTLNEAALQSALDSLLERHDALRATFTISGEEMIIAPHAKLTLQKLDGTEETLVQLIERDACTPFDLHNDLPIRGYLVTLSPQEGALVLTGHHIVCDGWSLNIIVNELGELYRAYCDSSSPTLPSALQFSDYAQREQKRDAHEREKTEKYWLAQFAEGSPNLNLPTDRSRGAHKSYLGATAIHLIDANLYQRVKAAGAARGSTLFATLLASFQVLLGRLAEQDEVVVGVPFAGQALLDDAQLVGHAVNFLPMRARWSPDATVADTLRAVSKQVMDARENQEFTLGTLVRKLAPLTEGNRLPITEVQFNLERLSEQLTLPELDVHVEPNPKYRVIFDLFLNITESSRGLRLECSYKTDLFNQTTIERWLQCYEAQLDAWATDSMQPLLRSTYVPAQMREQLLVGLNETQQAFADDITTYELIAKQMHARPQEIALQCGSDELTYAQLHSRVERLADYLASHLSFDDDREQPRIGICMARSVDIVVAMLAIWRMGCAYVPLDPNNPAARLKQIIGDAGLAALLITDEEYAEAFVNDVRAINVKALRDDGGSSTHSHRMIGPTDVAYLIYTSGSTGVPKGVEITHRSVVNLLSDLARRPGLQATDALLAVTTISFDIAVLELFLPLSVGARVVIAQGDEVIDGRLLANKIENARITTMQATPATWRLLHEAGFKSSPNFKMLCGGEPLSLELAKQLLAGGGELWNMYGPTETTVWSSCSRVLPDASKISVGTPIANTAFYILDANDQLAPYGVPGQLHIGGAGVARGYFKREALTAEKFIHNPWAAPASRDRLYRTGDRARYLENGEVQLLGRIDNQIKLRGYRIELGEIEAVLQQHNNVATAAVALREDVPGDARLVGYVVCAQPMNPAKCSADLRAHLGARLPEYMIPSQWVYLTALPTLPNGKLNRAALPAPTQMQVEARAYDAPQSALQISLGNIWREVLKVEQVGITDDFFALGGDSLHVFKIVARANREKIYFSAKQLIQHRTIAELARVIEEGSSTTEQEERAPAMSLREFKKHRAAREVATH